MSVQRAFAFTLLAAVGVFLWTFPIGQVWLAVAFGAYAFGLKKYPRAWLFVLPAAMPAFDLAFFSGWFFFDEFDALVLVTAAALCWQQPLRRDDFRLGRPLAVAVALLCASYAASTAGQLYPWPAIDANSFANYYSPFNALRVAKGFLWALLLLPHLHRAVRESADAARLLAAGLVTGLLAVAVIALYEHWLFVGPFNFGNEYRISGPFSGMHTGSGSIDLWLAATIPLIAAIFVDRWPLAIRLAALGVGCLSLYVLLATASRGPFVATACALLAMACSFLLIWVRRGNLARAAVLSPTVALVALFATVPFVLPTELGARFQHVDRDVQIRLSHFRHALAIRDPGPAVQLFGMGLGAFPRVYDERSSVKSKMARYSFDNDITGHHLTLRSGNNIYFGQKIAAKPHTANLLSFIYRTSDRKVTLNAIICEKWLLHYSERCSKNSFRLTPTGKQWSVFQAVVKIEDVGRPSVRTGAAPSRPTEMAVFSSGARNGISIDNLMLLTADGRNLIRNSDFSGSNNFWFWTEDNHWPWHTENLAVNVLFDQGWLGLLAVASLVLLTLGALLRSVWAGETKAVPWLGAMLGYLITAMTMSPFDQPRLAMLFYLLCFLTVLAFRRRPAPAARA